MGLDSTGIYANTHQTGHLLLNNLGSVNATARLMIVMPTSFRANVSQSKTICGASLAVGDAPNKFMLDLATVPAKSSCTYPLSIDVGSFVGQSSTQDFQIIQNGGSTMRVDGVPEMKYLGLAGNTGGMGKWWDFPKGTTASPVTLLKNLDIFMTPQSDPGPNSDIYYIGQISSSLQGYTGMQTPINFGNDDRSISKPFYTGGDAQTKPKQSVGRPFGDEGVGKLFLFSLWGNYLMAFEGTPATAGIGGGSYCNSGNKGIADGSGGAQCRYRYDWIAGHTYRFRVSQAPNQTGVDYNNNPMTYKQCFQSEVTDMGANWTKGSPDPQGIDKFVIGIICTDNYGNWASKSAVGLPTSWDATKGLTAGGSVYNATEWWDKNSRATCTTLAYSYVKFHVEVTPANGSLVGQNVELDAANAAPFVKDGVCASGGQVGVDAASNSVYESGGINQSARGLFMAVNPSNPASAFGCISGAYKDDTPTAINPTVLDTCPKAADVRRASYSSMMWVKASDNSISTSQSYCVTARAATVGSPVVITTCRHNEPLQKWTTQAATPSSNIQLAGNGNLCIAPAQTLKTGMLLATCSSATSVWTVPGKTYINAP